jgi:hypothetical protein
MRYHIITLLTLAAGVGQARKRTFMYRNPRKFVAASEFQTWHNIARRGADKRVCPRISQLTKRTCRAQRSCSDARETTRSHARHSLSRHGTEQNGASIEKKARRRAAGNTEQCACRVDCSRPESEGVLAGLKKYQRSAGGRKFFREGHDRYVKDKDGRAVWRGG